MRKIRMDGVYRLSAALAPLRDEVDQSSDVITILIKVLEAKQAFNPFFAAWSEYLGTARATAEQISQQLNDLHVELRGLAEEKVELGATYWKVMALGTQIKTFETVLEQEAPRINTYVVDQVGAYSTQHLIEQASSNIPADLREAIPDMARRDYDAAGRCLAFDLFTACGFHIVRALEGVVVPYHDQFTGTILKATDRNWGQILKNLKAATPPAPERLTSLLDHLRYQERNPIVHPERVLDRTEAITLFNLTGGTLMEFAKALKDLTEKPATVDGRAALLAS